MNSALPSGRTDSPQSVLLAWYIYPEPEGTKYTADDLRKPEMVIELFHYCQILLAIITAEGWQFLIQTYGIEGLLELDTRSGWLVDESATRQEQEDHLKYWCLVAGYNPDSNHFGQFDSETEQFIPFH